MATPAPPPTVDTELETLIRARYPILYVVSWEERRVEESLREICQRRGKRLIQWTVTGGLGGNIAAREPIAALDQVLSAPDQSVFLLKDFHPFMSDHVVIRKLRDLIYALKTSYKTLVLLSPTLKLPLELEKEVTVVDYQLPTTQDLDRLLEGIIQSVRGNAQINVQLTPLEREQILKAASGLTSNEAENVFAKSLVEKRGFDIDVILSEKEQIIRKSGILEYYRTDEGMADVGGMDLLKEWMSQRTASFTDKARAYGLPEPKGVLLLGVQGCGKSLTSKAIASLWRLPLLRLDVGKIFGGIVGQSEENMRKAISTAESVAPCVPGDTRITLADGAERTIQELYDSGAASLRVLGMDENLRAVPIPVRAITRRTAPDLFTLRMRHATLQATSNHLHPVLRDGALTWVRTDALTTGDHIAMPRQVPTVSAPPSAMRFLPAQTRLYAPGALTFARPEHLTPQRRYAARRRGADYVRIEELGAAPPPFQRIARFVLGRGGTSDSALSRLPENVNPEIGYLLGLLASDGFIGHRRIGLVNTDRTLHERFAEILCAQFGLSASLRLNTSPTKNLRLPGTSPESVFRPCWTSYTDNRLLTRFLQAIEDALLTLPVPFLQAWIRGYFDGDGSVSDPETGAPPKVTLTSKRPVQNRRVRAVLHRIGFPTVNPGSRNIEITGWVNVRRFGECVGSEHPKRSERLRAWRQRPLPSQLKDRTDPIPAGSLLRQARQEAGQGSHRFANASSSLIHRYETGDGHPQRAKLQALIAQMPSIEATSPLRDRLSVLCQSDVLWTPVLAIERAPTPEFVYDLVCDAPHTFVANGVFTHNCVLWVDELEKGFSGTQSSGISDGGTTSRVFGTFLAWMQDKKAPVFVIATSNDVTALPPELLRKGRFDEIFFVDLPSADERKEIFTIHLKKRKRDPAQFDLDELARYSVGFSGAEIEQVVVSALFMAFNEDARELTQRDLIKAIRISVPLSMTMRERIAELREWADERARPVSSVQAEDTREIIDAEYESNLPMPEIDEEEEDKAGLRFDMDKDEAQ